MDKNGHEHNAYVFQISFLCVNDADSHNQGACGVDDIKLWKTSSTEFGTLPEPACQPQSNRQKLLEQIDGLGEHSDFA